MVRYIKFIVIIFTLIGVFAGSFFFFQNKNDISVAWKYRSKIDYDHLKQTCSAVIKDYVYPCIKNEYAQFLPQVSLTGTSMGLKMVFTAMDEDKARTTYFSSEEVKNLHFSINFIEINNLALANAHKQYYGFESLYGGFLSSLKRYHEQGFEFSQNIILGLEGINGIKNIKNPKELENLTERLNMAKTNFYQIKEDAEGFVDREIARLSSLQQ